MKLSTAFVAALVGCVVPVARGQAPVTDTAADRAAEARVLFDQLAERYRRLTAYEDTAEVEETVSRDGEPQQRVATRIACALEGGQLRVETTLSQARRGMGVDLPVGQSPAMEALVRHHNLWLAPHMALHFAEDPLRELRAGVAAGFVPAVAEPVPAEGARLVRLELLEAELDGGGPAADGGASFELWVDREAMLVTRVRIRQELPDGAGYAVTVRITPTRVEPT